jgi:GNAT superfamily N-acetyltransferase
MSHLAELQLNVHPAERRRRVGSQLLDAVVGAARDHDVRSLLADATADSPADLFLQHHGFAIGLTLIYARLQLADADPRADDVRGYHLVCWHGVVPDALAQTFTDARSGMNDAPTGDIAYGEDKWDVDRTRHAARVIAQRGEHLMTVAAIDDTTGSIVGFTELVVPGDGKGEGVHYGTAVLPGHRGRGLARWIKTEQIRQTRQHFPDLATLLTDTVDTNTAMRHLNTGLGYQPSETVHRRALSV